MNRRTFNKLIALGGVEMTHSSSAEPIAVPSNSPAEHPAAWPDQTYRRFSIDTHVPDWDPQLLGNFDPAEYVGHIAHAGFQSMLQYTNSHVGVGVLQHGLKTRMRNVADVLRWIEVPQQLRVPIRHVGVDGKSPVGLVRPSGRMLSRRIRGNSD